MKKIFFPLMLLLVSLGNCKAQELFGNRYSSSYIISDKSDGMQRSVVALSPFENVLSYEGIRLEAVVSPSDTAYYLHYFVQNFKAPVSKGRRLLFKLKSDEVVELSAYQDCEMVSDTLHTVYFAHAFFGQAMKMEGNVLCAHYEISPSVLTKLIDGKISKVRMENDLSFEDFRSGGLSNKLQKLREAIIAQLKVSSGDLRENF